MKIFTYFGGEGRINVWRGGEGGGGEGEESEQLGEGSLLGRDSLQKVEMS